MEVGACFVSFSVSLSPSSANGIIALQGGKAAETRILCGKSIFTKTCQNLGRLPLTSEQTCWNSSMLCSFVNSTTALLPPATIHSLSTVCRPTWGQPGFLPQDRARKEGIAIPCQCRQAKEMPPTEGESGPIGRHPLVCNSLSVFGTTRAWLNQVFEAWRRPSLLSCQSTEGIPPQGMRKNRLSLIWPFPLGW